MRGDASAAGEQCAAPEPGSFPAPGLAGQQVLSAAAAQIPEAQGQQMMQVALPASFTATSSSTPTQARRLAAGKASEDRAPFCRCRPVRMCHPQEPQPRTPSPRADLVGVLRLLQGREVPPARVAPLRQVIGCGQERHGLLQVGHGLSDPRHAAAGADASP